MIRPASEAEAVAIINSRGVTERVGHKVDGLNRLKPFIVNERMLLMLAYHDNYVEAHIAQTRDNWEHIHTDITKSLEEIANQGHKEVRTSVTAKLKTTINLLLKHGFSKIGRDNEEVFLVCHL